MYNKIVNYIFRVLIIVLGIIIFLNIPGWRWENTNVLRIFGLVMILFGAYRVIAYHYALKSSEDDEDEDEDDNKEEQEKKR
ncbi:MAG TPA: hypothetical protein PLC04_06730 [Candidatus Kapabacteria bacterium]|nr:hypothetical protein [Candidatus Kapabacteria bacterium]